jgi:hypothetical protein
MERGEKDSGGRQEREEENEGGKRRKRGRQEGENGQWKKLLAEMYTVQV